MDVILENLYASRELYSCLLGPVCTKHGLTPAELLVLLFLANNTEYDSAKDIVSKLKITKSHVSISVRDLKERGYLKSGYEGRNRRTVHLQLCDTAGEIVADVRNVQRRFLRILGSGFSEEELRSFQQYLQKATDNINTYLQAAAPAGRAAIREGNE